MIWFSASWSLISLPNSVGLPALPFRMISVEGSNRLTSLPWLCLSQPKARPGLAHHLTDPWDHVVERLTQAVQHGLLDDLAAALDARVDLAREAPGLSDHPTGGVEQPAVGAL